MMGSLKAELQAAGSSVSVHTISPGMVLTGAFLQCNPCAAVFHPLSLQRKAHKHQLFQSIICCQAALQGCC